MDERKLVKKAQKGDKEAFAALYLLYRDGMYRYALFRLRNEADARDAVSACIAAAYEQIFALRSEGAFGAWIYRILYRECLHIAQERAARKTDVDIAEREFAAEADGTHLSVELQEAFSVLSDEDRDIVLLSVVAGYKSGEIAEILSMNPATVRSRLARSLRKMREFLEVQS